MRGRSASKAEAKDRGLLCRIPGLDDGQPLSLNPKP